MRRKKEKKVNNSAAIKPRKLGIGKPDLTFLLLVFALLVFGLIMLGSASYVKAYYDFGDSYYFIKRQLLFAIGGSVVMIGVSFFDYNRIRKYAFPLLVVSAILLVMVLIPGIGKEINGARRWLNLGVQFQPSELGKLAIIVSFASYFSANYNRLQEFKVGIVPPMAALITIVGLVLVETHLSAAILIFSVGLIMIFVSGVKRSHFFAMLAGLGVLGGVGVAGIIVIKGAGYIVRRFTAWLDPFADTSNTGYQIIQSLYAIASGGLVGRGFGQSVQKHMYLPEMQNDYVFSILCEELGFVGALLMILLFVMLIWRGFYIALNAKDKFGSLLVIGIISRVAVQTVLNIAVTTNAIPSTGIGLPFFSYGGTSLLVLLFEMGIVLSVSRLSYVEKT